MVPCRFFALTVVLWINLLESEGHLQLSDQEMPEWGGNPASRLIPSTLPQGPESEEQFKVPSLLWSLAWEGLQQGSLAF